MAYTADIFLLEKYLLHYTQNQQIDCVIFRKSMYFEYTLINMSYFTLY